MTKETVTYYILFVILLITLFSVGSAGLITLQTGSMGGLLAVVLAFLPAVLWSWWLAYVMKGCAGKQNWLMAN